ncbi:hypothetical protein GIY23_12225 [Allosaccharopolyspora coralli]|uniref:Uncharacterized protein n=1 Tax=Allosaccharopolyspora coralli TaxID=2665642 RepID=A0A5Q3Q8P4_9PSEU|nr:hypothetical protein [Allosaccharopolyspora coralli]QGK70190.1 hypothetical protein GIY23_12225 [Allosaccharopolyspora coralli]
MNGSSATGTRTTEHVSTREVHENAFRAVRAAGVSSGEAAAAATAVLEAEIQGWGGLHALLHEIDTLPGQVPAPVHGDTNGGFVVDDPARRGALLLGRSVFDVVAAQAARKVSGRVFVHGLGFDRALLFFAVEHAKRAQGMTVLAGVDGTSATTCALACDSYGRVHVSDDPAGFTHVVHSTTRSGVTGLHGGLSIAHFPSHVTQHSEWPVISTPEERMDRRAEAMRDGLEVPGDVWASVHRAARRFLVPEQANTSTDQG